MTKKRWLTVLALLILLSLLVLLRYWWSSRQVNDPPESVQQSTASVAEDNFLAIERAPSVTLDSVLTNEVILAAGTDMSKIYTIATTGDIIPARGVDVQIRKYGFDYPFAGNGIYSLLSNANLAVIDLEAPVIANCPVTLTGFTFCGQAPFAQAMHKAGIDVATLENNHIGNYGAVGIAETKQHLTAAGVRYATRSQLLIEDVRGYKVGFLAFNGVGGRFDTDEIKTQVAQARPKVDVLMVAYHWGKEYESVPMADPSIAPDDPQVIGRLTVDAGADVVIGNHPHWVQGVELYKGKLISYALGNFIFDQSWSVPTQQGMVATYTFYGPKLVGTQFTPIRIENQAQPRLATGQEEVEIFDQFKQSTLTLAQ